MLLDWSKNSIQNILMSGVGHASETCEKILVSACHKHSLAEEDLKVTYLQLEMGYEKPQNIIYSNFDETIIYSNFDENW